MKPMIALLVLNLHWASCRPLALAGDAVLAGQAIGEVIRSEEIALSADEYVVAELSAVALRKPVPEQNALAEFRIYLKSRNNDSSQMIFHPPSVAFNNLRIDARRVQYAPALNSAARFGDRIVLQLSDAGLIRIEHKSGDWMLVGFSRCGPMLGWGGIGPVPKRVIRAWDKIELHHPDGAIDLLRIDEKGVPWLKDKVYGLGVFVPGSRELRESPTEATTLPQIERARYLAGILSMKLRDYRLPRDENGIAITPDPREWLEAEIKAGRLKPRPAVGSKPIESPIEMDTTSRNHSGDLLARNKEIGGYTRNGPKVNVILWITGGAISVVLLAAWAFRSRKRKVAAAHSVE